MGYYRLSNGGTAATYESSSTAAYKHGRTETVRSCTNETKRACELFAQSTNTLPSIDELANALKACSTKHGELTKNAAMGKCNVSIASASSNLPATQCFILNFVTQNIRYFTINKCLHNCQNELQISQYVYMYIVTSHNKFAL